MLLDSVEVCPDYSCIVVLGKSKSGDSERAYLVVPVGPRAPPGSAGGVMGPPPIPQAGILHVSHPNPSAFPPVGHPPPIIVSDPRRHLSPPNHQAGPVFRPPSIPLHSPSSLLYQGAGSPVGHPSSSGATGSHQPVHGPTVFVAGSSNLQQMMTYLQKPSTGQLGYNATHQLYTNIRDSLRSNIYQGIRGAELVVVAAQMIVNEHGRRKHSPVAVRCHASSL